MSDLAAENARLKDVLEAIRQYGYDTLTGPRPPGKPDSEWYAIGVREMTRRARAGIEGRSWEKP